MFDEWSFLFTLKKHKLRFNVVQIYIIEHKIIFQIIINICIEKLILFTRFRMFVKELLC